MTPFSFAQLFEHPGDDDNLARIKLGLGFAALIALLYEAHRESEGTPIPLRWKKAVAGALAVLGVLSYFQFLDIGYPGFYHRHELFHYYLGSKYSAEHQYVGLYRASLVADAELNAERCQMAAFRESSIRCQHTQFSSTASGVLPAERRRFRP